MATLSKGYQLHQTQRLDLTLCTHCPLMGNDASLGSYCELDSRGQEQVHVTLPHPQAIRPDDPNYQNSATYSLPAPFYPPDASLKEPFLSLPCWDWQTLQ